MHFLPVCGSGAQTLQKFSFSPPKIFLYWYYLGQNIAMLLNVRTRQRSFRIHIIVTYYPVPVPTIFSLSQIVRFFCQAEFLYEDTNVETPLAEKDKEDSDSDRGVLTDDDVDYLLWPDKPPAPAPTAAKAGNASEQIVRSGKGSAAVDSLKQMDTFFPALDDVLAVVQQAEKAELVKANHIASGESARAKENARKDEKNVTMNHIARGESATINEDARQDVKNAATNQPHVEAKATSSNDTVNGTVEEMDRMKTPEVRKRN